MSGGNVQKVLVGRESCANPRVLLTAYAVRGLDKMCIRDRGSRA